MRDRIHDVPTETKHKPRSRRRFLGLLTTLTSIAITALAAIPILGTVISPLKRPRKSGDSDFSQVAELHQLETNVPRRVEIVQRTVDAWSANDATVLGAVWLVKDEGNKVTAFSTVCPHLGCAVNFDRGNFQCPCHTSAFRLDGTMLAGPAPRGMDVLPVEVRDNRVFVRYLRFKQGNPKREEA